MSKNEKNLKVVIIGCGDMGKMHAGGWKESKLAELVAAVDVDRERLGKIYERT